MKRQFGGVTINGKWNGNLVHLYENLQKILHAQKPAVWAVWNDLFHEKSEFTIAYKLFEFAMHSPQQIIIILTKRAERMKNRVDDIYLHLKRNFPSIKIPLPNIILMVTVENQSWADHRIPWLLSTQAAIRGVSLEPILRSTDLTKITLKYCCHPKPNITMNALSGWHGGADRPNKTKLDWVICGMESLGNRPGRIFPRYAEAIRNLKNQCVNAKVPFFFKQAPNSLFDTAETGQHKLIKMPELDGKIWNQLPGA